MKTGWLTTAIVLSVAPALVSAQPQQASSASVASETSEASKTDNLREKPFIDGRIISAVKAGQRVDIQKRDGSWYFVKTGTKTGWLPMLSVRRTKPVTVATKGSTVQTGRSSTGTIVSTTGVRGFNEETLKAAPFSDSAVAAMEKFRVPVAAQVVAFANAVGVTPQAVPALAVSSPVLNGGRK
jgi:uncharacterized protein YgiM (DUF1202 family)